MAFHKFMYLCQLGSTQWPALSLGPRLVSWLCPSSFNVSQHLSMVIPNKANFEPSPNSGRLVGRRSSTYRVRSGQTISGRAPVVALLRQERREGEHWRFVEAFGIKRATLEDIS